MAESTCVRLEVALECGAATISGTIIDDHSRHAVHFSGWLELMSALDTACARLHGSPPSHADPGAHDQQ